MGTTRTFTCRSRASRVPALRQLTQVGGIELHRPDVKKLAFPVGGHLDNDLRLADAARTPEVQVHTFADQHMKRLVELGRFYEIPREASEVWAGGCLRR